MDTLSTAAHTASTLGNPSNDLWSLLNDALIISILGYAIVFLALVGLSVFMIYFTKLLKINLKKKLAASGNSDNHDESDLDIPGEVNAAIALALHKHFAEIHDFENTVITIRKVQRPYSPWSSKIYGLRHSPRN